MADQKKCKNPDCGRMFTPVVPWKGHCSDECRNHHTYLRTTLPKRHRMEGGKRK